MDYDVLLGRVLDEDENPITRFWRTNHKYWIRSLGLEKETLLVVTEIELPVHDPQTCRFVHGTIRTVMGCRRDGFPIIIGKIRRIARTDRPPAPGQQCVRVLGQYVRILVGERGRKGSNHCNKRALSLCRWPIWYLCWTWEFYGELCGCPRISNPTSECLY